MNANAESKNRWKSDGSNKQKHHTATQQQQQQQPLRTLYYKII